MARAPHVDGAADDEHLRSPAARRTAQLAAQSGLFFAHYEHRSALAWPAHFLPDGVSAEPPPGFVGGVLAEPKYGAFRHDLLVASFHPSHRAQWTAHELCHVLVGFAFRPSAPSLFHALAAWLAELLPVSLWYFFDEAHLRRCPRHAGQGPLFQLHCAGCEEAAKRGPRPDDAEARRRTREGLQFMDRELAAIARSRRNGSCEGTRYATIDLASDALAYLRAHGRRLAAPETAAWAAQFFDAGQGMHGDLDALEARVLAVRDAILGQKKLRPHRAGRHDYAAQDLGYRLMLVRAQYDDGRGVALDAMIARLARERTEAGLARAVASYRALCAEPKPRRAPPLPSPDRVLGVGYDLPDGAGRALSQLGAGIASACPSTWRALGRRAPATAAAFCAADAPLRAPLGRRFARFLAAREPGAIAELAALEAAVSHALPPSELARSLPADEGRGGALRLADHAELVPVEHDVAAVAPEEVRRLPAVAARYLGVVRGADDGVDVLELPRSVGDALLATRTAPAPLSALGVSESDGAQLLEAGLLLPAAYRWAE